jgi:tetratricopeptide (TPR) repeat protein
MELSDLSHAVWRDSLRFYREAFKDLDDSDPEMALAKATAHSFTGNVSYLLRDYAQADSDLDAARALLKPLVDTDHLESIRGVVSYVHSDWPARRERENAPIEERGPVVALFQLAQNLRLRGMVAHARGEMGVAKSLLRDSVGEFERVLERASQIPLARYFLAEAHYQLARIAFEDGDHVAAQRESSSAIDLLRLAMADDGEHPRYVVRFCDCAVLLLGEMLNAGRFDEAENVADDAEGLLGRLCRVDPGHILLHICRAENARLQGRVASACERFEAALEPISAGIEVLQPLARRHPDHENLRQQSASLHADKATALCCLARFDEAEREWALADERSAPPWKWYFRACRAQARLRAGDFSRGADDAAALLNEKDLNAETLMAIVGIYARCLVSETDADLVTARRDLWLTSAVSCLERLAALDYFCEPRRVYWLYSDPAMSPLRASEQFVAWLEALRDQCGDSPDHGLVEADSLRLVGSRRLERGEIDSAIAGLSRGIDAARRAALGSGATARDTRNVLEGLYWVRARARTTAGLRREAIADLKEAVAFDSSPGRASTRIALGRALLEVHDFAGAAAVLRELAAESELSGPGAFDLAIVSAQIRSSFNASEVPSSSEFARLDQELYDQVVSSLNRALAEGFFETLEHRDEVRNNVFLIVFRGHAEFDSLLASLPMP